METVVPPAVAPVAELEEGEEEEDEEIITIEVTIDGKLYLKDDDSNLYDVHTHEFIRNLYE